MSEIQFYQQYQQWEEYFTENPHELITVMDDKKFKEELSKVARWYIPIVSDWNTDGRTRRPMPDSKPNESLGPIIDEVLPKLKPCEWCGKIVDQKISAQRVTNKLRSNRKMWLQRCTTCSQYYNSDTKKLLKCRPNI